MADVKNNMVHGIKPVLQTLQQLERETYKQIVKDLKNSTEPLRVAVANEFPDKPYQSASGVINWTRYGRTKRGRKPPDAAGASFPKWESKKVKKGVQVKVGGRKVRRGANAGAFPILRVIQSNAAGAIWDLAKNQQGEGTVGQQFVKNLNTYPTKPSRVMWKAVPKYLPLVEKQIDKIIDDIGKRFTVQIANATERRNAQSVRASKQVRTALGRFGKVL